jgi:type 1 fimbria pilin
MTLKTCLRKLAFLSPPMILLVFTMLSFAAPQSGANLSATGEVTVNGALVSGSSSVSSGSLILTDSDGDASLDVGQAGRIQLRPNSSIKLVSLSSNSSVIEMQYCSTLSQTVSSGSTAEIRMIEPERLVITVTRGEVEVQTENSRGGKGEVEIEAGDDEDVFNVRQINASGDAAFTITCCQCCFTEKVRTRR